MMRYRTTVLLTLMMITSFLRGGDTSAGSTSPPSQPERVKLTVKEHALFTAMTEMILQHGAVPTREEVETILSRSLDDDERASISAKLYYEQGIVGALLSDEESTTLQYLIHRRRPLGSLGELADHIRKTFPHISSTLQVLRILEFLHSAGYIDVRDKGQHVYMVIPQGLTELYPASSIPAKSGTADPFDNVRARLSEGHWSETKIKPVTIGKPDSQASSPRTKDSQERLEGEQTTSSTQDVEDEVADTAVEQPAPAERHQQEDERANLSPDASPEGQSSIRDREFRAKSEPTGSAAPDSPEPTATVASPEPLGPPVPADLRKWDMDTSVAIDDTRFNVEVMKEREKHLLPCAPDFWGWPYLYGQDDVDILAFTTDTGSEVRITIRDGQLISYTPLDVIAFHGGQHGDIRFFHSQQSLNRWRRQSPEAQGQTMTIPEAIAWARRLLQGQRP